MKVENFIHNPEEHNRIYTLIYYRIPEFFPKCLTRILSCLIVKHSITLFIKLNPCDEQSFFDHCYNNSTHYLLIRHGEKQF